MADRETVIGHLQIVRTWASVGKEPIYHGIESRCCEDVEKWMDDALALLREQEPVAPRYKDTYHAYCGACGCRIPLKIKARCCYKCGRKVKWDDAIQEA